MLTTYTNCVKSYKYALKDLNK